jgi:hypothetical protein
MLKKLLDTEAGVTYQGIFKRTLVVTLVQVRIVLKAQLVSIVPLVTPVAIVVKALRVVLVYQGLDHPEQDASTEEQDENIIKLIFNQ